VTNDKTVKQAASKRDILNKQAAPTGLGHPAGFFHQQSDPLDQQCQFSCLANSQRMTIKEQEPIT